MRRQITGTLGTVLAVGLTLATSVALAAPRATGKETFRGVIVASGESDARSVVTSLIVARGVFAGGGRIVEIASRPGDPANVNRDDLVFPQGRMHLISTIASFIPSVNPKTCAVTVRGRQTGRIHGGTGKFSHAAARSPGLSAGAESPHAIRTAPARNRGRFSWRSTSSPSRAPSRSEPRHRRLPAARKNLLDLGKRGPSKGDVIVDNDRLLNGSGKEVGRDGIACTITDESVPEAACQGSFVVPGGEITVQFLNSPLPVKIAAITGGTGRYRTARGQVRLVEPATGKTGSVSFSLAH